MPGPFTHVRESLEEVAGALGTQGTEVVVLATAMFISVPGATVTQTAVASAGERRLDQIDDLFELVDEARFGAVTAGEGLRRLEAIRVLPEPFPALARVLGYAVLALGIALIIRGAGSTRRWPLRSAF